MPLKMFGTEAQKKKYLPGIIKGELIGCFRPYRAWSRL